MSIVSSWPLRGCVLVSRGDVLHGDHCMCEFDRDDFRPLPYPEDGEHEREFMHYRPPVSRPPVLLAPTRDVLELYIRRAFTGHVCNDLDLVKARYRAERDLGFADGFDTHGLGWLCDYTESPGDGVQYNFMLKQRAPVAGTALAPRAVIGKRRKLAKG